MTICKDFLQGTCIFGENCKFEHQLGGSDHNDATSTSNLLQNYASKPVLTTSSNVDSNVLVQLVVDDMTSAEKSGQWLLSSYAPFKDKPTFPGFKDHSMEEIRYLFYESMRNGTVEQFDQNLQMMMVQAMMNIKALQKPSPKAVNMLKLINSMTPSDNINNNQLSFSVAPTNTSPVLWGSAATEQKSVFGNPPNQNHFGGSNTAPSVFRASPPIQQTVFGGFTNRNGSIFDSSQNTVFSKQQATPSVFGGLQQTPNTNLFGENCVHAGFGGQTTSNSLFTQTPFTAAQNNTPFVQNQSNPFHLQTLNNQFEVPRTLQLVSSWNKPASQHFPDIFLGITEDKRLREEMCVEMGSTRLN